MFESTKSPFPPFPWRALLSLVAIGVGLTLTAHMFQNFAEVSAVVLWPWLRGNSILDVEAIFSPFYAPLPFIACLVPAGIGTAATTLIGVGDDRPSRD